MADKFTPLIVDALTQAAADPSGVPLFASKSDPGLFPNTTAGKPAAAKALAEGLLSILRTETKGKQTRELATATDAGLQFLLDQVSPKQVLEDFVRVLERREGEVSELMVAVNRMTESLIGLKSAVAVMLPRVEAARIAIPEVVAQQNTRSFSTNGEGTMTATLIEVDEVEEAVLARLSDWSSSAAAGQDCPLPDLYRSLACREDPPSIGVFHDGLRTLHAAGRIYLHPWTGPLYALPEPAYALLVGHNVAYYASVRH